MKRALMLCIATLTLSCGQSSKMNQQKNSAEKPTMETSASFDWLSGKWKRLNDEQGKQTFENWTKVSVTEYSGIGYTMDKKDTVSQEQMSLIASDGKWRLVVQAPGEKVPTEFKMVEVNANRFVCINDSIDFPKRIEYWVDNDKLNAKISNEKMEIPFEFEKIK